jgi:hypothetical protein
LWLAVLLSLASCAPASTGAPQAQSPLGLAGRTAGPPERCIVIEPAESFRVSQSDRHTLLYGTGRTIWANHLGSGCGFNSSLTLVTQPIGSSHCRGDLVRSFDSFTRIPGPSCILGEFTPYTHQ